MIGVRSPKGFMFNIRSSLSTEVAIKFLQFLRGFFLPYYAQLFSLPFIASISSVCVNIKTNMNEFYCLLGSRGQQEKPLDKIYKQSGNWMLLNTQLVFLASHYIIHDRVLIAWTNIIATSTKRVQNQRFARYARYGNRVRSSLGLRNAWPYNTKGLLDLGRLCAAFIITVA